MPFRFLVRRFLTALVVAFLIFAGAHLLRGRPGSHAVSEGLVWALISAALFTGTRWYGSRQGQSCPLCADTPDETIK